MSTCRSTPTRSPRSRRRPPDAAVILLGPQVRFELNRVKGLFPNIPVESINPQDYGLVRGENVLNHAIELAGK